MPGDEAEFLKKAGEVLAVGLTIEATDAHGNVVRQVVPLMVPHDTSGHPDCVRVSGLDALDAEACQR